MLAQCGDAFDVLQGKFYRIEYWKVGWGVVETLLHHWLHNKKRAYRDNPQALVILAPPIAPTSNFFSGSAAQSY